MSTIKTKENWYQNVNSIYLLAFKVFNFRMYSLYTWQAIQYFFYQFFYEASCTVYISGIDTSLTIKLQYRLHFNKEGHLS